MAKYLQKVLDQPEPAFSITLRRLEALSGRKALDTRLVGEIMAEGHRIMRAIGLDPNDTTALELYEALKNHADNKSLFLRAVHVSVVIDSDVISFSPRDIAANRRKSYGARTIRGMQKELSSRLAELYVQHAGHHADAVRELLLTIDLAASQSSSSQSNAPSNAPDIICIGDLVVDEYIELSDDMSNVTRVKNGELELSMPFGGVISYEDAYRVLGSGSAANAAAALARLGARASLMSWAGNDDDARLSIAHLSRLGIDTTLVAYSQRHPSQKNYILKRGDEHVILERAHPYLYKFVPPQHAPDWLYLASISRSAAHLHADIVAYLKEHPDTKLAFLPGMAHIEWGLKKLRPLLRSTTVLALNHREALMLVGRKHLDMCELIMMLHHLGPDYVIVTDGANGAHVSVGHMIYHVPAALPTRPIIDTVGAGDAFAATFVSAIISELPIEQAGRRAALQAAAVVTALGGQEALMKETDMKKQMKKSMKTHIVRKCR